MGHVGVGWVMQGWGGSCRGGVGLAFVFQFTFNLLCMTQNLRNNNS